MRISYYIDKDAAVVGVMYYLSIGIEIKSKKCFKREVTEYFRQNGHQCIDDHESENEPFRKKATELVEKYFKHP